VLDECSVFFYELIMFLFVLFLTLFRLISGHISRGKNQFTNIKKIIIGKFPPKTGTKRYVCLEFGNNLFI
jgi:hypothetical protein